LEEIFGMYTTPTMFLASYLTMFLASYLTMFLQSCNCKFVCFGFNSL